MIIALKKDIRREEREQLISWLESYGVKTHISEGDIILKRREALFSRTE